MYKKSLLLLIFILSVSEAVDSPSVVYEEYNNKVASGISFEEEKKYYSTNKIKEVESSFPRYMSKMKKSRDEVIKFYLDFSRSVAKCKKIKLIKEKKLEESVILIYSQSDICGNKSSHKEKQIVKMVDENGWKISSIEIGL